MPRQSARRVAFLMVASILGSVLIHAQKAANTTTARFRRGDHVREKIRTKPSEPPIVGMIVTVVAVPGDRIRAAGSDVYVNEVPVSGFSKELLARVARSTRLPAVMRENEYLVMGEQITADDVFNKWGTYAVGDLEAAK